MQYLPAKYKNNNNLINNIRNQSIGFTLIKYMYKRQRLFTSIELTTVKVPEPLHIWVVYKVQGDYSMLRGLPKKDVQPERTNRRKSIIDRGIAIENDGFQKQFLVQWKTTNKSVFDWVHYKLPFWIMFLFPYQTLPPYDHPKFLWLINQPAFHKIPQVSWDLQTCRMKPGLVSENWSPAWQPCLKCCFIWDMCHKLEHKTFKMMNVQFLFQTKGLQSFFPLLKIIIECTQYQWLNHLIDK